MIVTFDTSILVRATKRIAEAPQNRDPKSRASDDLALCCNMKFTA
jgi:hypothetical protein